MKNRMILIIIHTFVYTLFDSFFTYTETNSIKMAYTGVHYSHLFRLTILIAIIIANLELPFNLINYSF